MSEKFNLSVILKFKDETSGKMTRFGKGMSKLGKGMLKFGKMAAAAGVASAGVFSTLAIRKTEKFQGIMNMVGAVTKSTAVEFKSLNTLAKTLGATTQFSATDAADAMKFMGMAGLNTNKIFKATPKVLQLAAAAQLDMGTSADIVTNIMAGFGDAAGDLAKVNDVLVTAFTGSNVNLQQLGAGLRKAGPVASKLGFAFTETAAALGLLGSAGFQGEEAGVGLRRIMANLVAPTKQQEKAMRFLELEFKNADGSVKSMVDVLKEFEGAQKKGASESQIAAAALQIFGQRGGPQLLALLGQGSGALEKFNEELKNSEGRAKGVEEAMKKGLPGAFKEVASSFEAIQLAFGESPIGDAVEKGMRKAAESMRGFAVELPGILEGIFKEFEAFGNMFSDTKKFADDLFESISKVFTKIKEFPSVLGGDISGSVGALAEAVGLKIPERVLAQRRKEAEVRSAAEVARQKAAGTFNTPIAEEKGIDTTSILRSLLTLGTAQNRLVVEVKSADGTSAAVTSVEGKAEVKHATNVGPTLAGVF